MAINTNKNNNNYEFKLNNIYERKYVKIQPKS